MGPLLKDSNGLQDTVHDRFMVKKWIKGVGIKKNQIVVFGLH